MDGILIGYARCSTAGQDLRAQRTALKRLGVPNDRIYTDKGYTGRNRHRPGLREALAACREGGTLVVAKLDRLGRSAVDLRAIADELEAKGTRLNIGGSVHDPTDPTGKLLSKGQNVSLPGDVQQIDVVLGWAESGVEVDASALLLNTGGKVRSDSDFVFYNQPESADGSVRFLGVSATEEGAQARIAIDLAVVPTDVHSVALVGSVDAGAFGDLGKLALRVVDGAGHTLAEHVTADATTESAFVFGEVYRRNDQWKVRAVGQGWASGLVGLATDFGVDIDDAPDSDVTMSVAEQPTAAATSPEDAAPLSEPSQPAAATKEKARGVRTAKRAVKKSKPIEFTLAENDAWQPARLFSVAGVGAGEEQERRATSALVATMQAVRPFARAVCARVGAPAGAFEGYVEVQYERGETKVLTVGRSGEIVSFSLEQTFPMGTRRSGTSANFISSVTSSTDAFYGTVVQKLREFVPAAPKQTEQSRSDTSDAEAALRDTLLT